MKKTDSYWRKKLTPYQYHLLREKGTEIPFTGTLLKNKESGVYKCMACGQDLFSSETKFESESGWPSFFDVIDKGNIKLEKDNSFGMQRTAVSCANCGSHLGHLFTDGPADKTGLRYCLNSDCLNFKPAK